MKTDLELLILLKENLNAYMEGWGMCYATTNLLTKNKISVAEYMQLIRYLQENRPASYDKKTGYFYEEGVLLPRLQYLDRHIKKLTKK